MDTWFIVNLVNVRFRLDDHVATHNVFTLEMEDIHIRIYHSTRC